MLTVAAVARRIGVAPATLRTWARRYGLGPSSHEIGEHRRYCPGDLAKLTLMRRLISAGVAPADAAEQALAHKGEVKIEKIVKNFTVRQDVVEAIVNAANILDKNFVEDVLRCPAVSKFVYRYWCAKLIHLRHERSNFFGSLAFLLKGDQKVF